ncbi:MAG: molybdopterin molybdotransferase MoeA [Gammaproteobacteria bacterium]
MIDYHTAIKQITKACGVLPAQSIDLASALQRTSAAVVNCDTAIPPFANSAMDGFALRSSECNLPDTSSKVEFEVAGTVLAGQAAPRTATPPGQAWEIMTGAEMPSGFDCVVPVERVSQVSGNESARIEISTTVSAGQNVRNAGEDFKPGQRVLPAGKIIDAADIMALSAAGIGQLEARTEPRIAIVVTGNELSLDNALETAMIRDANGPFLYTALNSIGISDVQLCAIGDTAAELQDCIEPLLDDTDLIITTGGVSAGKADCVPAAIAAMGANTLFHKVSIRPGKPLLGAQFINGPLVLGLPGNPVAVAAGFSFFVRPALRKLLGQPEPETITATLSNDFTKKKGLRFFAKAKTYTNQQGQLLVDILPGQESFKINPLLDANAWAVMPEDQDVLGKGELVEIVPLLPGK